MKSKAVILFAFANPEKDLNFDHEYNPIREISYSEEARRTANIPQAMFDVQVDDLFTAFRQLKGKMAVQLLPVMS